MQMKLHGDRRRPRVGAIFRFGDKFEDSTTGNRVGWYAYVLPHNAIVKRDDFFNSEFNPPDLGWHRVSAFGNNEGIAVSQHVGKAVFLRPISNDPLIVEMWLARRKARKR